MIFIASNPAAINIIQNNLNNIDWNMLSRNYAAIHILEANPDKINFDEFIEHMCGDVWYHYYYYLTHIKYQHNEYILK
jgi:hypothetical protein